MGELSVLTSVRKIEKTSVFTKDLKSLQPNLIKEVWKIVRILGENVFDSRLDIKKLEGYKSVWRVSLRKNYRLIFTFDTVKE